MKPIEEQPKVSRRNFLKGVGIAATAVAAAGCGNAQPIELFTPEATPTPTPLPVAAQYPGVPYTPVEPPTAGLLQVLTPHEARTVEAYTARLLPGTPDDPGAREAGVVYYIDNMLAFNEGFNEVTYRHPPYAQVYTGDQPPVAEGATVPSQAAPRGAPTATPAAQAAPTPTVTPPPPAGQPISETTPVTGIAVLTGTALLTSSAGVTATQPITASRGVTATQAPAPVAAPLPAAYQIIWVPASEIVRYGYQSILSPRDVYRIGVAALDRYSGSKFNKDFVDLSEEQQDQIIGDMVDGKVANFDKNLTAESFFHNVRRHTSEGMFSDPVYGGNRGMVGWKLVGYPGAQRGYEPDEFQREGTDRQPQSIAQLHWFNPGQPANDNVILPVSGAEEEHRHR